MVEIVEGSSWSFTSEHYPMIKDTPVKVMIAKDNFIQVEIDDKELVRKDIESAKKTLVDNGGSMDNVKEVHPFVTDDNDGKIIADSTFCFFKQDKFLEQCDQR